MYEAASKRATEVRAVDGGAVVAQQGSRIEGSLDSAWMAFA